MQFPLTFNNWYLMVDSIFRDLKAENLLLGPDGLWKLCDFGSTSTNHKRFEKPEEMGIEEDNIRKHTTPAYRAPEVEREILFSILKHSTSIFKMFDSFLSPFELDVGSISERTYKRESRHMGKSIGSSRSVVI